MSTASVGGRLRVGAAAALDEVCSCPRERCIAGQPTLVLWRVDDHATGRLGNPPSEHGLTLGGRGSTAARNARLSDARACRVAGRKAIRFGEARSPKLPARACDTALVPAFDSNIVASATARAAILPIARGVTTTSARGPSVAAHTAARTRKTTGWACAATSTRIAGTAAVRTGAPSHGTRTGAPSHGTRTRAPSHGTSGTGSGDSRAPRPPARSSTARHETLAVRSALQSSVAGFVPVAGTTDRSFGTATFTAVAVAAPAAIAVLRTGGSKRERCGNDKKEASKKAHCWPSESSHAAWAPTRRQFVRLPLEEAHT
jgi:hypothetical protein